MFDALIVRLIRATSNRGKKADLARFLGVPISRVSEWLNRTFAPGGEITLRLLEWVQAEEAQQQKTLGDVTSATKGKTRSTQSKHEKEKRVRRAK
jgi:hypothetical protein